MLISGPLVNFTDYRLGVSLAVSVFENFPTGSLTVKVFRGSTKTTRRTRPWTRDFTVVGLLTTTISLIRPKILFDPRGCQ